MRENCVRIIYALDGQQLVEANFLLERNFFQEPQDSDKAEFTVVENNYFDSESADFDQLAADYSSYLKATGKAELTIKKYSSEIDRLGNYLKEKGITISDVDLKDIRNYLNYTRDKRDLCPSSYSKAVISIRVFLRYLFEEKNMKLDFFQKLKAPKPPKKEMEFLTEEDIRKVENFLNTRNERYKYENLRDLIIFYLGIKCGLRKSEMLKIRWEDIDLSDYRMVVKESKGKKSRKLYFSSDLKDLLDSYRKKTRNYKGPALRGSFGGPLKASPLQDIIKRLYKGAKITRDGLTLHSLRHTYAVTQKRKGTDTHTIKQLMGHESLETTDKYLHSLGTDLKSAAL